MHGAQRRPCAERGGRAAREPGGRARQTARGRMGEVLVRALPVPSSAAGLDFEGRHGSKS